MKESTKRAIYAWRTRNQDKVRQARKAYNERNKEKISLYNKTYYAQQREARKAKALSSKLLKTVTGLKELGVPVEVQFQ